MKGLLCIFLALALGGLVRPQSDFQLEQPGRCSPVLFTQFSGGWYSIGLASDAPWFQEKKAVMKMSTVVVAPTGDGNLEVTYTYPRQDQCETRKSSFLRTEQPGLFSYTSPRSGSVHTVQVLDINRHEYALLLAKTAKGAGTSTMVTLYGRSRQLRPELQEKFRQAALAEGLAPEDVLILPQTDQCMPESV
ncbi:lipocalin-like [Varanus komodoensis]|uniref:lipocalin-like n=1 Tax=Varanus komodoensis TaxID=61221 RepID=UPI001CF7E64B|nr:lipocalin-like [Varanus komodoensis]